MAWLKEDMTKQIFRALINLVVSILFSYICGSVIGFYCLGPSGKTFGWVLRSTTCRDVYHGHTDYCSNFPARSGPKNKSQQKSIILMIISSTIDR